MTFDIFDHNLVPDHEIMTEEEIEKLYKELKIKDKSQLPKIKVDDPVSKSLLAKEGQVLRITRISETAGKFSTYRLVIGEKNQK